MKINAALLIIMTIVILMVIPVSNIYTASAITSVPGAKGAKINPRGSFTPGIGHGIMNTPSRQKDVFATQSQGLEEASSASNTIIFTDSVISGNEPSIAAHPTNPKIVLAFHKSLIDLLDVTTNRTCDIQRSTDGGKTWSNPISVVLPPADDSCTDPVIRWAPGDGADKDKNVRVYATYLGSRPDFTTQDVVVIYSDDNGLTWSPPVVAISGTPNINIPDKPWIATGYNFPSKDGSKDNDRIYLVSMIFFGNVSELNGPEDNPKGKCQVVFTKSLDGGKTFPDPLSPKVLAESGEACTPRMEGPIVAGGPHDSALVCWYHSDIITFPDTFDIRCRTSKDGGKSFSNEIAAAKDRGELPFFKCPNESFHRVLGAMLPSLEITPDGTAHMVYSADPTPGDSDGECGDIFYAKSLFPWDRWTPTKDQKRVNDDSTATFQGFATITSKIIGKNSILVTAWEDDRKSAEIGDPNLIYDVYSATIDKNGNISPNQRVTDASSFSDFSFIGDYFDASVHRSVGDKIAHIIWTDRREISDIFDLRDDIATDIVQLTKANCIVGTNGDDNLKGKSSNDCIKGKGGNDKITGLGGNDNLSGGEGNDIISGGKGDDELSGGSGADTFQCGSGNDKILDFEQLDKKAADCEKF